MSELVPLLSLFNDAAIIIAVLMIAMLWRQNSALREDISALTGKLIEAISRQTEAAAAQAESNRTLTDTVNQLGRVMELQQLRDRERGAA